MIVIEVQNGVVGQVWRDVTTVSQFTKKYKLSGSEYVTAPKSTASGMIEDGQGGFKNPAPAPKSTSPNDYNHTRRQFKTLLTDAMEAEIKAKIQSIPNAAKKREIRIWWEETAVFEWADPTMIKLIAAVEPATATAIEAAWIA